MQLSSLFLAATAALLARAAPGDYRLTSKNETLSKYSYAGVKLHDESGYVVFSDSRNMTENAIVRLDENGDIGSKFTLRIVGPAIWALLSTVVTSVEHADITKPFAVESVDGVDNQFVYAGPGEFEWVACLVGGEYRVHLAEKSYETGCTKDIGLTAVPA
ncbi:uncharacterized protein B0H64DRAFT_445400 [Chaetomium fimeti]|uniref:Uncharacterized protein n=1 Tax=Chaetomium fimeti TaxID=1854472 RepID=A0AAE0LPG8_9PEZI|nr:hypothetical protein B0H64DRAFT_445400 [Chaetomium fimeti]